MRWRPVSDRADRGQVVYAVWDAVWIEEAQHRIRGGSEPYSPSEAVLEPLQPDERAYLLALQSDQIPGCTRALLAERFGPRSPYRGTEQAQPDEGAPLGDLGAARLRRGPG